MTLISQTSSPLDDLWVAIDLETTGLNPETDDIIEVGAVKFQGPRVLDTFQTFVNPRKRLSTFIRNFTGIAPTDVEGAPAFHEITEKLAAFLGNTPLVGHSLDFDLGFLSRNGITLSGPRCDTWDMAYVLLPACQEYSLRSLAKSMDVPHARPHRAVDDAAAAKGVFLQLLKDMTELDLYTISEMRRLSGQSNWSMDYLLRRIEASHILKKPTVAPVSATSGPRIDGLDMQKLVRRLRTERSLRPNQLSHPLDPDQVASMLGTDGPLSKEMDGFEIREEQIAMAREVTKSINEGGRLIVEAGTGVGKSLAYLFPAAMYALANNRRVVVSTNTINLQDQLLSKDIPILLQALAHADGVSAENFKYTQLKGRANYMCLRRWTHLRSSDNLSESEARLLAKTLVWLQSTCTGDRNELNMRRRDAAAPWEHMSAQGATDCPRPDGACFLQTAREKALAAHLVIVNHALLLSDLSSDRSVIPDHGVLIIDEAHHLEEQATRQLGFDVSRADLDEHLQATTGEHGILNKAVTSFRGSSAGATRRKAIEELAERSFALVPRAHDHMAHLFELFEALLDNHAPSRRHEIRVTPAIRSQPAWSDIEVEWENVDLVIAELGNRLDSLRVSLEGLEEAGLIGYGNLISTLSDVQEANSKIRHAIAEFVAQPKSNGIYWMGRGTRSGELALHAAPLHVGETLDAMLFSKKDCVVMTSATLSTKESFAYISERTGFTDAEELLLDSPFDYANSALVAVPHDMPEPNSNAYQSSVERAVSDAALAAGGATMALFTSHAALQTTAAAIRGRLQSEGLSVLAQGVDGTPQRLLARFLSDHRSVLLGTASFWEGVDLAGESLKVLLLARLPFNVPTEPVFSARSEMYENSFGEYAVPQAILRLRQGFGRLIRTKSDRGVAVVLDRRIVSRQYGRAFLESLPPVVRRDCRLHDLEDVVRDWLRM